MNLHTQVASKKAATPEMGSSVPRRATLLREHSPMGNQAALRLSGRYPAVLQGSCDSEAKLRRAPRDGAIAGVPQSVRDVLDSPGRPLDPAIRQLMESRFVHDFSDVRIHTDASAAESARAVNANAFTFGTDIVFNTRRYQPSMSAGRALIAHELTHVVQQRNAESAAIDTVNPDPVDEAHAVQAVGAFWAGDRMPRAPGRAAHTTIAFDREYTPAEIRKMRGGTVTGGEADNAIAQSRGFEVGDVVFRQGSSTLARYIGTAATHGGIYLGGGLVHDVVGFGNRTAGLSTFYEESVDRNVVRIARFIGPEAPTIVRRLLRNISTRDFKMPTGPKPFNLFSSADDYETATCLEYAHAQFLHAITQLSTDPQVPDAVRRSIVATYFPTGATQPTNLIQPRELKVEGEMPTAALELSALMAGADLLGSNVDKDVFENKWEGQETLRDLYDFANQPWWRQLFMGGPLFWQTESLRTYTYQSFVDASRFFQTINPR